MATNNTQSITIPSEPVGSLPRPKELIEAQQLYRQGKIDLNHLNTLRTKAVQDSIEKFEATGSTVITDGEQTKPSFLSYPIGSLIDECYTFSDDCFSLSFNDGHKRTVPHLTKAPFRYGTYAHTYVDEAKKYTRLPIK
jgi:5-methyltetrahydropteroyltriglutamate--homocysteine methyltransferase